MVKTGSWCNPWNSKMIADKIDLLFNDEKSWKRIYENNLMLARDLSWEKRIERLYNAFVKNYKQR